MKRMLTSAVSLRLLVLLEAQSYHNFYRSGTNRSRFLVVVNTSCYFVHQRLLVSFSLGVLLSCMFVHFCLLLFYYNQLTVIIAAEFSASTQTA